MTRPCLLLCLVPCLLLAGCPAATRDQVAEGEALLERGRAREAAKEFHEALLTPGISGLDRVRAAVGEAHAYLALGDLNGAEARLRRIEDTVPAKWYFLGRTCEQGARLEEARGHYQRALDMAYGADTGRRLALLVAAEARAPEAFGEAAKVARRGGGAALADALEGAAEVWRQADGGHKATTLLAELNELRGKEGRGPLPPLPAVEVLRARLLEGSGLAAEAKQAWSLSGAEPKPGDEFKGHAQAVRARLARERGDLAGLEQVLSASDHATAARIRAEVCGLRLERGDLEGALEVARLGAPKDQPNALAARYLELLGRDAEAAQEWQRAAKGAGAAPGALDAHDHALLLADWLARQGDPLGAALLDASSSGARPHLLGAGDRRRELAAAAELLARALDAEARGAPRAAAGRPGEAAARLLLPGDPALATLAGEEAPSPPAGAPLGATAGALATARALRALRAGRLADAADALKGASAAGTAPWLAEGLRRGLRRGAGPAAPPLVARLSGAALDEARASADLAPLTVQGPRGPTALAKVTQGPWGSPVEPARGARVPLARARAGRWEEPGGSEHEFAELAPQGALFYGAAPGDEPSPFGRAPRPVRGTPPLELR
ncbi:MAG: hypothetical protein AB7N76_28155 [Planctomycetota bacterium]